MIDLGTIGANVTLNLASLESSMAKAEGLIGAFGSHLGAHLDATKTRLNAIGNAMLGVGGVMTGIAGASVDAAAKWQEHLSDIRGNTTLTVAQIKQLGQQSLDMARKTGQSAEDISTAYMHVTNLSYSFADAQKIVAAANESAVSAGAKTADTSRVLAQVMRELNIPVSQAAQTMDLLHVASANSTVKMEEFVHAGARVFGVAGGMGLKLKDILAVATSLTKHGFPSMSQAATQAVGILTHIRSPSQQAENALKAVDMVVGGHLTRDFSAWGLETKGVGGIIKETKADADTFAETLVRKLKPGMELTRQQAHGLATITGVDLHDAIKNGTLSLQEYDGILLAVKNHQADWHRVVDKLITAQRGGLGAQALMSTGMKDLDKTSKALGGAGGTVHQAFIDREKIAAQQTKILQQSLHALSIEAGQVLLPYFVKAVEGVTHLVAAFGNLPRPVRDGIAAFVGVGGVMLTAAGVVMKVIAAIGGLAPIFEFVGSAVAAVTNVWGTLVYAFEAVAAGAGTVGEAVAMVVAALGGPVTLIVAGVAAATAGLAFAWSRDFGHIREVTASVVGWLKKNIGEAWQWIKTQTTEAWNAVRDVVGTAYGKVQSFIQEITPDVRRVIQEFVTWLSPAWSLLWGGMKVAATAVWEVIKTVTAVALELIKGRIVTTWGVIKDSLKTVWDLIVNVVRLGWDVVTGVIRVGLKLLEGDWRGAWTDVKASASKIWADIKTLLGQLLRDLVRMVVDFGKNLFEAGTNAAHALGNGIKSGIAHVKDQAAAAASSVVSTVKNILQIHSPSRVMMQAGQDTVEGLRLGLQNRTPALVSQAKEMTNQVWDARQKAWKERSAAETVMEVAEEKARAHRLAAARLEAEASHLHGKGNQGRRDHLQDAARSERSQAEAILHQAKHAASMDRHSAAMDSHSAALKAHHATALKQDAAAQKAALLSAMNQAMETARAKTAVDIARAITGVSGTSGMLGAGTPDEMRKKRDSLMNSETTVLQGARADVKGLSAQADTAQKAGDLERYKELLDQIESKNVEIATLEAQQRADRLQMNAEIDATVKKLKDAHAEQTKARQEKTAAQKQEKTDEKAITAEKREQKKDMTALVALRREQIELTQGEYQAERFDAVNEYLRNQQVDPALAAQVYTAQIGQINTSEAQDTTKQDLRAGKQDLSTQVMGAGMEKFTSALEKEMDRAFKGPVGDALKPIFQKIEQQMIAAAAAHIGAALAHVGAAAHHQIAAAAHQGAAASLQGAAASLQAAGAGGAGAKGGGGLFGALGGPWGMVAGLGLSLLGGLFGGGNSGPTQNAPFVSRGTGGPIQNGHTVQIHVDARGAMLPDYNGARTLAGILGGVIHEQLAAR